MVSSPTKNSRGRSTTSYKEQQTWDQPHLFKPHLLIFVLWTALVEHVQTFSFSIVIYFSLQFFDYLFNRDDIIFWSLNEFV